MDWNRIFAESIEIRGEQYAENTAITYLREDGSTTYTSYKQVADGCKFIKNMFCNLGIGVGDRVAIVTPHSPQGVLASLGVAYAGTTIVLVDASLPDDEINRLLEFSDVRGIFTTEKLYKRINDKNKKDIPVIKLTEVENEYQLFEDSTKYVQREKTIDPESDVMAIIFSSGTTAQMKGIKVTYEATMKAAEIFIRNTGWKTEYKYLHVFPLNHIAGYATVHTVLSCGSELGLIENMSASKLQSALLKYQPHGFGMVPKVFEVMEDKIRERIREKGKLAEVLIEFLLNISGIIRRVFGIKIGRRMFKFLTKQVFGANMVSLGTGASVCRKSTSKFFIDLGLNWSNFYALTETNVPTVVTGIFDKYPVLTAGNVKRNPEIDVKISNKDADGIGEVYIKSELIMKGYFREDELTKQSFDGDYFKTGDYGYIDKKGNLYITGRVKESILLHNGKKISPTDVENYYKEKVPQIEMACCGCAKENSNYDEVYMFIQTSGKEKDELTDAVDKLSEASVNALYKLDHIKFIEKLPLTSVGKVKRFELQKCAMMDRDVTVSEKTQKDKERTLEERVAGLICKVLGREERVSVDTRIKEDLGLDSLNIFELQTEIELSCGVKLVEEWINISTVGDLVKSIEAKKKDRPRRGEADDEHYIVNRTAKDMKNVKRLVRAHDSICKIKYVGLENLIDEPCIFAANHSSHLDVMSVYKAIILRFGYDKVYKVCCLAAKELAEQKGMRKTFHAFGAIPVDRKNNAAMALVTLNKYIDKGYSAVIFPEGTRTRTGKIGSFTHGAASTAIKANVPIIPIGIVGSYDIWPATRKRPRFSLRRKTVTATIGKPIYPTTSDVAELTDILKKNVVELCKEK